MRAANIPAIGVTIFLTSSDGRKIPKRREATRRGACDPMAK